MKKTGIVGFIAGLAIGVAGSIATAKVVKEIKEDFKDTNFISPDGNNIVTLTCGASRTARGLAYVKVRAHTESSEDECKLAMLSGKKSKTIASEWSDNNHFSLTLGEGKLKQYCDVDFSGEEVRISYSLKKIVRDNCVECEAECEEAVDASECDEVTSTEE